MIYLKLILFIFWMMFVFAIASAVDRVYWNLDEVWSDSYYEVFTQHKRDFDMHLKAEEPPPEYLELKREFLKQMKEKKGAFPVWLSQNHLRMYVDYAWRYNPRVTGFNLSGSYEMGAGGLGVDPNNIGYMSVVGWSIWALLLMMGLIRPTYCYALLDSMEDRVATALPVRKGEWL